jgi:hypothetical protein
MKRRTALLAGLLFSPLVPAVVSSVMTSRTEGGGVDFISMLAWIPITYAFSLFAELLFGLPIIFILWRFGLVRWWSAILGGMFSAVCLSIIIRMPNIAVVGDVLVPENILMGAVSAFFFWLFWRLGSDNEASN